MTLSKLQRLSYNYGMKLLLISSSYLGDGGYLEHCQTQIKHFLSICPPGHVLFVPYAGNDLDYYADRARDFFTKLDPDIGSSLISLHKSRNPKEAVEAYDVKAIFIAGGNTFRLLKALQNNNLLGPIRNKIKNGAGYMGTSAGSNVACPTIMTTNDMPIVETQGLGALNLIDFQINPHFVPGSLIKNHQGETREQRIKEYHQENACPVIGLPEASWISIEDNETTLGGVSAATLFEQNAEPREWIAGTKLPIINI